MTDYKRWQDFLMNRDLWDEFKEKMLKNYKGCGLTMLTYFNLIAHDQIGEEDDKVGQEDLITSAFPIATAGLFNQYHPDIKWDDLHREWITYLISVNHLFKEHDDE